MMLHRQPAIGRNDLVACGPGFQAQHHELRRRDRFGQTLFSGKGVEDVPSNARIRAALSFQLGAIKAIGALIELAAAPIFLNGGIGSATPFALFARQRNLCSWKLEGE
jgi:hypothetical protein